MDEKSRIKENVYFCFNICIEVVVLTANIEFEWHGNLVKRKDLAVTVTETVVDSSFHAHMARRRRTTLRDPLIRFGVV
jgi:hypothetical protein